MGARLLRLLLAVAIAAAALLPGGAARAQDPGLTARTVATLPEGEAVFAAAAPGVRDRLYAASRTSGTIYSIDLAEPGAEPQPFLSLPPEALETEGERGLLSVAFAPDFARSRRLYVYFTNRSDEIEVDEYRAPTDTRVRPTSRRRVISIPHGGFNHFGGTAAFGPGGLLYLATGDGGNIGDPRENAQNRDVLLGKLLRIDPRRAGRRPYTAPRSNPFWGKRTRGRNEILALGLRNPFRFSFSGRTAWIGDVGQFSREEVDRAAPAELRGANFGWDRWEGTALYRGPEDQGAPPPTSSPGPSAARHTPPFYEYSHAGLACASITGGVVAPATAPPAIAGRYLYADFCAGALIRVDPRSGIATRTGVAVAGPTSFAVGPDGQVYASLLSGEIVRIEPTG